MGDADAERKAYVKAASRRSYMKNREKVNARSKDYAARNPERMYANNRAHKERRKAWREELKAGPCADCGVDYPSYVKDWDHRPGEIKLFNISKLVTRSKADILAEIAKCDLVCANCHRERTHQRKDASKWIAS